jgi:hypothetical protein
VFIFHTQTITIRAQQQRLFITKPTRLSQHLVAIDEQAVNQAGKTG